MKKVGVYLGCHPYGGGTFQYSLTILDALYDLRDEGLVDVFVIHENFDWDKTLKDYGFSAKKSPDYLIFKIILKIWKILRLPIAPIRFVFDKIHPLIRECRSHNCETWIFPSQDHWPIFISSFKTIGTIHDLMHRYEPQFPEVGSKKEFQFREFLYSNLCKYADTILVDSELGKKQVLESYGEKYESKILPLHYTIPKTLMDTVPDLDVLKRKGVDDTFFIFYPAQFWEHKNHLRLLKAFIEVKKEFPQLKLVLSGSKKNGSDAISIFIQEHRLENEVILLGYISDQELAGLYKLAKAMVMPTFFGPTNIPPLEAEYFDCPVVYSNIYAANEFLGKYGKVTFISPQDYLSIANGINQILTNKFEKNKNPFSKKNSFKNKLQLILNL